MIATVAATSTPLFTIHSACTHAGINYVELREGGDAEAIQTANSSFLRNSLVVCISFKALQQEIKGLSESSARWGALVIASDEEAHDHAMPFMSSVTAANLTHFLNQDGDVSVVELQEEPPSKIQQFLKQIQTEIYRIPKDQRPTEYVYQYLFGTKRKIPNFWPDRLIEAVKVAEPLRVAIQDQNSCGDITRTVADRHAVDLFEINYVRARATGVR